MPIPEPSVFALQRAMSRTASATNSPDKKSLLSPDGSRSRSSSLTRDSDRPVNWYNEYVARNAQLSIGWLPTPLADDGVPLEVRGIGLHDTGTSHLLISPLDDGSLGFWDVGDENQPRESMSGELKTKSKPGTYGGKSRRIASDIVEGLSLDHFRQKAYIATGPDLTEVDLNTFQSSIVFQARQAGRESGLSNLLDNICTLSEGGAAPTPLTVGSSTALHIFDPRINNATQPAQTIANLDAGLSTLHGPDGFPVGKSMRRSSAGNLAHHWARVDPLPLSVLHESDMIHVGGRFPFILDYDRRNFPRLASTTYSGARISALTTLPTSGGRAPIVAAGEYKGKGSLEIYPDPQTHGTSPPIPTRNRTSASRSKLLSVISHGNRILFSDSDGQLKWVERDGCGLVRRWNINQMTVHHDTHSRYGIFNAGPDNSDVARKLLKIGDSERSEVCVWTGEKVGIMCFGSKPRLGSTGETDRSASEAESEGDEQPVDLQRIRFERMMRRALQRQADEVRMVPDLGLR